jgi:hypothetical protein
MNQFHVYTLYISEAKCVVQNIQCDHCIFIIGFVSEIDLQTIFFSICFNELSVVSDKKIAYCLYIF